MFFHQSQKSIIYPIITINGAEIERVANFNFLGVIINKNLKCYSHINYSVNKMSANVSCLLFNVPGLYTT